jgi:hypothetical protein
MEDLSLQEAKSREITRSDTDRVDPILARDDLTCEAWLGHGYSILGESESDPLGDNANHHKICCSATIDPNYKSLLESDSDSGWEVFMVGSGEPPIDQTVEEIVWEAKTEIERLACLACEADKATEKTHQGQQDDSGASEDEAKDGAASGGITPSTTDSAPQDGSDSGTALECFTRKSTR